MTQKTYYKTLDKEDLIKLVYKTISQWAIESRAIYQEDTLSSQILKDRYIEFMNSLDAYMDFIQYFEEMNETISNLSDLIELHDLGNDTSIRDDIESTVYNLDQLVVSHFIK